MDRMSFVPGTPALDAIENANGRIYTTRAGAIDYANEFILKCPSGPQPLLYRLFLTMLSDGDELEIKFSLRDPTRTEHDDPAGELVGHTWAVLKAATGGEKLLYEVGRKTDPISDVDAAKAFNGYRKLLAVFHTSSTGMSLMDTCPPTNPIDIPLPPPRLPPPATAPIRSISRALSPSNLYFAAGAMFYFVDLSMVAPSRPEFFSTPLHLSRPMQAFDALILSALVTLAIGAPPLVFSVLQANECLGVMPDAYGRAAYALAPECRPEGGRIVIVG
ncbi:hypothetical protein AJ79_01579 [Helicocarpus griseus UAMH5409]|uniref:Uncharacterized protein n=1 Tax=Helicocarpus griseus UAMH5409 TaxID=1447875 RepID=A0A2B7Y5F4_9EURO|nr:hypothetical protein AJ79_01579 [Helicocarpus griseus UAMH5409]